MNRFKHVFYSSRHFMVFFCLEIFCLSIYKISYIKNNDFFDRKLDFINSINAKIAQIRCLFVTKNINKNLLDENSSLRLQLLNHTPPSIEEKPTKYLGYDIIPANVINNSIIYSRNYLTIDKGAKDGIQPGMGVICGSGVVGKVCKVSENFAVVVSILNIDLWTSAEIKETHAMGSIRWPGVDPRKLKLVYVPKDSEVKNGYKVITTGYGTAFYPGIPIGIVSNTESCDSEIFLTIEVHLSVDIAGIKHVMVIKNNKSSEINELERQFYE